MQRSTTGSLCMIVARWCTYCLLSPCWSARPEFVKNSWDRETRDATPVVCERWEKMRQTMKQKRMSFFFWSVSGCGWCLVTMATRCDG
eukprot:1571967-Rhodomonas_salina.1